MNVRPLLESSEQVAHRVCKSLFDSCLPAQVIEDVAQVRQNVASGLLQLAELPQGALPASLLDLEILQLDQHRREGLRHAIVQLTGKHSPDLVRAFADDMCRVASHQRQCHPSVPS